MTSVTKNQTQIAGRTETRREARPFVWLEPAQIPESLPSSAAAGLPELQAYLGTEVQLLMRNLVDFSLVSSVDRTRSLAPSASVLNRRRRSAGLWINAILAGNIDKSTLHSLIHTWGPQLAGSGPDRELTLRQTGAFVEYLRGAMTGMICSQPEANLVPQAWAIHCLETVLAIHLRVLQTI